MSANVKVDYMTAAEVAALCGCDVKTIHNWCDSKKLPHARTPGRRYLLAPHLVVPKLKAMGYIIPPEVQERAEASAKAVGVASSTGSESLTGRSPAVV